MDPLIGDGLRHPKDLTKDILCGGLAEIHQNEQQLIRHRRQGAIVIADIGSVPGFARQGKGLHLSLETH